MKIMKCSHNQHIQHRLSTHINRCFNPHFLWVKRSQMSLFHGFKHASRLPPRYFAGNPRIRFGISEKNIAFLIFYAHNPAISWAPFQKSWASLFHHLPLWMEKNKKNKSDNTLHCSLLFPKNGLLHDHQLVVGQVACQKGLALGVTDMTRKNRREIGPLTIETYWNRRLSRQKWWLDMILLYFTGWWVLTCYNHLEKWWSSSMGRMTSLIWNGK